MDDPDQIWESAQRRLHRGGERSQTGRTPLVKFAKDELAVAGFPATVKVG